MKKVVFKKEDTGLKEDQIIEVEQAFVDKVDVIINFFKEHIEDKEMPKESFPTYIETIMDVVALIAPEIIMKGIEDVKDIDVILPYIARKTLSYKNYLNLTLAILYKDKAGIKEVDITEKMDNLQSEDAETGSLKH